MPEPGSPPDFEWGPLDERIATEIRQRVVVSPPGAAQPGRDPRAWVPRLAWAGVAAIVALAAIVTLAVVAPWQDAETDIPPISALESTPTPASERAARQIGESARLEGLGIRSAETRELVAGARGQAFVVPAAGDQLCILLAGDGGIRGSSCAARTRLATAPIGVEIIEGGRLVFVGLVPDGYESARLGNARTSVEGNGFMLESGTDAGLVQVVGEGLPDLQAPVGEVRAR